MSTATLSTTPPTPPSKTSRHTGKLFALTGAVVGVIYGYDTGSISGALVFLSQDFQLTEAEKGLVNSILVGGSILGALIGGKLADALGRKAAMLIVAASYAVFVALSALAPNVVVLDAVRFLLGVAIGISIVAAPLYIAESTPARIRGASVAAYQVATVAGIVLTYFVNWGLSDGGHWRWMLGLSAIPAALVLIPLFRLPDTPRWYVLKGRTERAVEVMAMTDPDVDPRAEVAAVSAALAQESGGGGRALLHKPYVRATLFVVGLGFFCQITGINAVTYYSPQIFEEMGFTGDGQNFLLPSFVQLASLAATVLAILIIDRLGRRAVLLSGIGTMVVMLAVLTVVFGRGELSGATHLGRLRRDPAVHRGVQFRLRLADLGLRRRGVPGPAALHGGVGDAHRRPRRQSAHRPVLPVPDGLGGRCLDVRRPRGARSRRPGLRLRHGARDQGPPPGRDPGLLAQRGPVAHPGTGDRPLGPKVVSDRPRQRPGPPCDGGPGPVLPRQDGGVSRYVSSGGAVVVAANSVIR